MISLAWTLPFVLLLACTALLPLWAKHFWEKSYWIVSLGLGAVPLAFYLLVARDMHPWLHEMKEYVSFIVLLGSLYIVSGGIYLGIKARGTPTANATLLLIGAGLANVVGTTGASMLLLRPFLRMNAGRIRPYQIVFFIFIVANVGGALTPIGDPPLFLGYLQGVPFWWVFEHCQPMWWVTVGILVSIFLVLEMIDVKRHPRLDVQEGQDTTTKLLGVHNFLFIAMILYAVFQTGVWDVIDQIKQNGWRFGALGEIALSREPLMIAAAILSRVITHHEAYHRNEFSFGAIKEVAILFIGIFSTMTPALQWLEHHAKELPLTRPGHYYYSAGSLSAFLDNAPTYLTFLKIQLAQIDDGDVEIASKQLDAMADRKPLLLTEEELRNLPANARNAIDAMVQYHPGDIRKRTFSRNELEVAFLVGNSQLNLYLVAISLGAVFFGACSYIGNGPNFMVKNIADAHGAQTPSFMGYIFKYSLPILVPTFTLVWWIFLR